MIGGKQVNGIVFVCFQMELNCLSRIGGSLCTKEWDFEPLDASGDVALKMQDKVTKTIVRCWRQ